TSEILGVISQSPADVQPVFDAIARHGVALCGGVGSVVVRYDGSVMLLAASHNVSPLSRELHATHYPRPLDPAVPLGAAILDRAIVHVPNLQTSTRFAGSPVQRSGRGSMIAVPLLREGEAIGAIGIGRDTPGGFSDREIALLQTFADQAVIAIENVRLFTETKEALERQTATSEILQVISSSPTDVQPVFHAIAKSAARLCEAFDAVVYRVDGDVLRSVAHSGSFTRGPVPLVPGTINGRAVIERRLIHVVDAQGAADEFPEGAALSRQEGTRSLVSVPLLRTGNAIATIGVRRFEVRPFSDNQIALLQTFADQAVIAIENVRLFKELEVRNTDLAESLEQQTATAEVLRVISSSPTDLQPVLDTVVASAARFCGAYDVTLFQVDGDRLRFPAHYGPIPVPEEGSIPLMRGHVSGRAVLERRVVHLADVQAEAAEFPEGAAHAQRHGHRTIVAAPLLREGAAIGALLL